MTDPRMPAILQVIPELSAGGAERTAMEISEAVTKAGGRSFIASQGGRLEPELARTGATLIRFSAATKNPLRIVSNADLLTDLLFEHGIDLVHARSRAPAWSAAIAARRMGVPFITTYHGIYSEGGPFKRFYNRIMARGDAVIANSHYTASVIQKRYPVPPERLHVIHRGVDVARFDVRAVTPERLALLRASWGLESGQDIVLYPARLTRWKGQSLLIEAVAAIRDAPEVAKVVFVLVGDAQGRDGYEEELRRSIAAAGLEGRVLIAGHCGDMPAAFALSRLAVAYPCGEEAFGRVSIEAQAMGCPVIAADIGALPETLRTGDEATGWLVPPSKPEALAAALVTALRMPAAEREAMGARGAAFVRETFSLATMQLRTLQIYDSMLGTRLTEQFKGQ
jgi:glycosyltransferase involved in cell wall biosynthesis